jgi:hypothetical protein
MQKSYAIHRFVGPSALKSPTRLHEDPKTIGSPEQNKKTKEEKAHENTLRRSGEILRYAPKGTFACFAEKSIPLGVARFFASLFTAGGWREDEDALRKVTVSPVLDDTSFLMVFFLNDPHQALNAKQAINDVFHEFGFEVVKKGETEEFFGPEHGFRAFLAVTVRR